VAKAISTHMLPTALSAQPRLFFRAALKASRGFDTYMVENIAQD
jgi:hypothetical protein